jgi:hypothetical protein
VVPPEFASSDYPGLTMNVAGPDGVDGDGPLMLPVMNYQTMCSPALRTQPVANVATPGGWADAGVPGMPLPLPSLFGYPYTR